MPVSIEVPTSAWSEIDVPLNGELYTITYRFNDRDQRWRMDIRKEGVDIILGVKIVGQQSLLSMCPLEGLSGDIQCHRNKKTTEGVGRDNLGVGKEYELLYFAPEELI